ncbi:hypothetical protein [Polycladidibacter stylochi]|uniref:hypothetical protein n=1 Tax=Polycladidibacter stylochi TaxID=1807766 RepID=UPI000830BD46|nr:hypothetical protein [Pseudovibrio stylochi]
MQLPSLREAQLAIIGSWRIFLGKPGALAFFDLSLKGFWRSFAAIIMVAPLYYISLQSGIKMLSDPNLAGSSTQITADFSSFYALQTLVLVLDWIAYPLVLALLAGSLNIQKAYFAYIATYNWSTLLLLLPHAALSLLYLLGLLPAMVLIMLSLPIVGWSLYFRYILTRYVTGIAIGPALGLVALGFLLSLFIDAGIDKLLS